MEFNNDFRHDLTIGQGAENFLGKLLEGKKLEVKMDRIAHKTGRVFVEYESRGKLSGISTTEADYWCYIIEGRGAIIVSTERMKEVTRAVLKERGNIKGGDSNTSLGALVEIGRML